LLAVWCVCLSLGTYAAAQSDDAARQADPSADASKDEPNSDSAAKPKLGLQLNLPGAQQGYTLMAPEFWKTTYLIDMDGKVVKTWESDCFPGHSAYLLPNGNLLRTGQIDGPAFGFVPGAGGRVQEFTWDGELIWDYKFESDRRLPHHDVCKLPNGNVLMIVWEKKTADEAIAAGRLPESLGGRDLLVDYLMEVKPTGKTTAEIVWEWHLWDHLIQNAAADKANFGDVAAHPELVDLNYGDDLLASLAATPEGLEKLKSLGYVGTPRPGDRSRQVTTDWTHTNAVAYNAELDQIMLSIHAFSEIWIIDHSTTTAEAAGHTGGRYGKGGDLLYRWGNPMTYRAGTAEDRKLFRQHNAHWIPKGLPGEGHVLVFNNGQQRPGGEYSTIDELVLPADSEGHYAYERGKAYGPDGPVWSYHAPNKEDFYASFISGVHRLPNGNTFICSGPQGTVFEVTPEMQTVWKYINPVITSPPGGPGDRPRPGQILPTFLQDALKLTDDQKGSLRDLQKKADETLSALLDEQQRKQWDDIQSGRSFGGGIPRPGQVLSPLLQARLKLTDAQKQQLKTLQTDVDEKVASLLTDEQSKQFQEMSRIPGPGAPGAPGAPAGPGGRAPGGPGPVAGGPPPGRPFGGMPMGRGGVGGPGSGGPMFRATRYPLDYPPLAKATLTPGPTVEELIASQEKKDDSAAAPQ
jgi:hypothetical protein